MTAFGPGAFRMALAVAVVVSHLSPFEIGRPAVFLFFTLSGYWIMKIRVENAVEPVWRFYLSRGFRVWVPFAVAYVLACLVLDRTLNWDALGLFGIASHGRDVLGVSWSLDIELQFYICAPLIVWMVSQKQWLLASGLTVFGWGSLLMVGIWSFLAYLPCFLIGAVIYNRAWRPSGGMAIAGLGGFVVVGFAAYFQPDLHPYLRRDIPTLLPEDWFGMIWVLLLVPACVWSLRPSGQFDRSLGDASFAVYLVHWPVISLLRPQFAPMDMVGYVIICIGISAVAAAFFWGVDRPSQVLRKHLFAQKRDRICLAHS